MTAAATGTRPGARIRGLGLYRPANLVTNDDLAKRVDTSDEWIRSRTGIATRRVADEDESVVAMAAAAGGKALAAAGLTAADIDLVLVATCSNKSQIPAAAPQVAYRLGATKAGASDVNGACAGFCYALAMAADSVRAGSTDHVLVIGSERLSDYTNWDDRGTCILLADGAGAAVVSRSEVDEIGPVVWGHNGERNEAIYIPGYGDNFMRMEGQAVYRWAVALVPLLVKTCERAGITPGDLAAFVPHQANMRIIQAMAKTLGADKAIIADDVVDAGNTSAASVPMALTRLVEDGRLRSGDPALLFGFGAGLSYAGQVVRVP
ncbi:MAG: beta-ketoacyl-ACP synthase III [Frankia sp.]